MAAALEVDRLVKVFRVREKAPGLGGALRSLLHPKTATLRAVDGISFVVERGEMLAFIGPNGAGKSTTIKLITGILFPDAGRVAVLGLDPHRQRRALAYRIGTVFGQKSQLWYHLPPLDSFRLLADIYDLDRPEAEKRIGFLAEVFEIGRHLRVPVRKLSLGERIRCEIAASLLHRPEILFLDEPTIGLDVVVKQRIRDLILRMNQAEGTTVFLTSHDAGDIEKICRRVIVINNGRIVWDDTLKAMKYRLLRRKVIDLRLSLYAARDQLAYLPAFLVRNLFFVAILFVFYSLWRVVYRDRAAIEGFTLTQMLWYLTFTEAVELARPRIFAQIQEEVKDGSLAYSLARPCSYPLVHLSRSLGESAVRLLPILAMGYLLAALFAGPLPGYLRALPFGLVLIAGGVLLGALWQLVIGLLAFWTEEVAPFYWIVQKAGFILGRMFIPIDFFPPWLGGLARWLPFAFSAYWPASCMVRFSFSRFLTALAGTAAWALVLGAGLLALFALGKRRVHVQGG